MLTLRQLRYFAALAKFRHFGAAASNCAVTQPALSTQIQDLEKKLGVELVERRHKNVSLTPVGRNVADRVERILAEVRALSEYTANHTRPMAGRIHIGVIPSIAPYLLPPVLPKLRESYPGLELRIRETQTHVLTEELLEGSLDLLLLALPIEYPDIETMPLFEDRFFLAVPPDQDVTGTVKATSDLIRNDRLLLLEEGHCLRDQALSFCGLHQTGAIDTFGISSLSTIVQMVANGLGLTLLPELSIDVETRNSDIRLMRFAAPEPSRTVGLAWRSTSPRKSDFRAFGKLVAAARPVSCNAAP